MTKITKAIKALVTQYISGVNYHPSSAYDINNGLCEEFAMIIDEQIEGAYMSWGDQLDDKFWGMARDHRIYRWAEEHAFGDCFIIFKDRYYDSEAPEGVDHPKDLPFYVRRLAYALKHIDETSEEFWARIQRENPDNDWSTD